MGYTLAQKIIKEHILSGEMTVGSEIGLKIDQTLTQDATGTMAYLEFEAIGIPRVKTEKSVAYIDHNTLQTGFENADDHRFIQSVAKKRGLRFSRPGNGICHQVHLERFGKPGKTLIGSDSHTPTGGGIGMLAMGAGGLDVAVAMGGGAYYISMPKMVRINLTGKLQPWVAAKDIILEVLKIMSVKGGVGKTTTALNLGAALAAEGRKVLLIDNDPQGNLTSALGYTPGEQKNTLAKLLLVQIDSPEDLELYLPRTVVHTGTGIDLIPANKRLADAAARLQVMQLSQYNTAEAIETSCEMMMDKLLDAFREQYDYIVIDCGLKHELLTVNALAAADYCIIPVQAHFLASEGIPDVLELVKNVQSRFNSKLEVAGILLTMYQSRPQLCQSVRAAVAELYGDSLRVFERPIEQTIKVAECPAAGMSILDYAPRNPAAESYRSLAQEVLQLG
mgnify:CR=1 FL=1